MKIKETLLQEQRKNTLVFCTMYLYKDRRVFYLIGKSFERSYKIKILCAFARKEYAAKAAVLGAQSVQAPQD